MKKNIVITGSNSGFGRLTALTLARDGHRVFATMRAVKGHNAKAAESLVEWARTAQASIGVVELDVTDAMSVATAVRRIADECEGQIDVVVNNAGVFTAGLVETYTVEQTQALFDVNVFGPMRVNRAVLPYMRERRSGLLLHTSSVVGRVSMPFMGTYGASKFALEAVVEALRYEVAGLGIDVALIEPGAFPTDIGAKGPAPADTTRLAGYGAIATAPQKMFEGLALLFASPDAPDPQDVADAIKGVIDAPAGGRPVRTVVDRMVGTIVGSVNQSYEQGRSEMLKAFGM